MGTYTHIGVENGNPLQYSCLENSMDRGAWQLHSMGLKESNMTEHTHVHIHIYLCIYTYIKYM